MDITISDGVWTLSELSDLEFDLLRSVPAAADPGESESAQKRLFPGPLREPTPSDAEFVQEWNAYVTDDLITQFSEDLSTLSGDLKRARIVGKDEDGDPVRTLEIPLSHAPQWFSALNQARIVLSDIHQIYNDDGNISPREDEDFSDFHQRWRRYVQSNYYAGIQEWLVMEVLSGL